MTSEEPIVADALVESLRALHRDDPAPVYVQIERRIRMGVADGTLQPGDHLPSVRDLARQLGLSPNTVGRAYAELSREGVIMARAGGAERSGCGRGIACAGGWRQFGPAGCWRK